MTARSRRAVQDASVSVLAGVLLAGAVAAVLAEEYAAPTPVVVPATVVGSLPAVLAALAVSADGRVPRRPPTGSR